MSMLRNIESSTRLVIGAVNFNATAAARIMTMIMIYLRNGGVFNSSIIFSSPLLNTLI
jgi:hypothetical protein